MSSRRDALKRAEALELLRALWAVNHLFERTSKRLEALIGVTAQQRLLLRLVGANADVTPGKLAHWLCVDASTISTSLKRLEARGVLRRRADKADRRRVTVELSAAGRALDVPEARSIEATLGRVLDELPEVDAAAVREFLARLAHELDEALAAPASRAH